MHPNNRREAILGHVEALGACSYQELAALLGVSEMTVRRDVDGLARQRALIKTLGGVQIAHAPESAYESAIHQRLAQHRQEKAEIAAEAASRIGPQRTVFVDGGTTCLVLARRLAKEQQRLTMVTYSALACLEYGQSADNEIVCLGGQFDPVSACFVGPAAEEAAKQFFVDVAFFSTKAFLPRQGTYESSVAVFRIKQIFAEQATRVVLLVDHSKFNQRGLCKVLDLGLIHEVITDAKTPPEDLALLVQRGITVSVARPVQPGMEAAARAS
jgi:DeoR/GlpR family transcriptional regulator of sugar metabolism